MISKYVVLESERLFTRQANINDSPGIVSYFTKNREYLQPFEPIRPEEFYSDSFWKKQVEVDLNNFLEDRSLRLFMFLKDQPATVIGMIHFSGFIRGVFQAAYLGYSIDEDRQGKGLMTEALHSAIDFMFKVQNFHRIMANCMIRNSRSLAVLKKLGFEEEGRAKEYLLINGKWEDHILTSLINSDFTW